MAAVVAQTAAPMAATPVAGADSASQDNVELIMSMGYTEEQAKEALRATENNLERLK